MRIKYPVFHFFLLRPAANDSLSDQIDQPDSSVIIANESEYGINNILNTRRYYGRI